MFFTESVVGHWTRLLREMVTARSLSEFKEHQGDTLSPVVRFYIVLYGAGSWTWLSLWVPSSLRYSMIL